MTNLSDAIAELQSVAVACTTVARANVGSCGDDALVDAQRQLAAVVRLVESASATVAAEVGHRSRRELGYDGLAQKRGARTPEALVQVVTGSSLSTARRLVRVGTEVAELAAHQADPAMPVSEPWLAAVIQAVAAGDVSGEALDVIRAGLRAPTESVSVDALAEAARTLLAEAPTISLERLAARSREARDLLDTAGVAAREQELRDRRYLRLTPQLDGMTRISGLLDPESAAIVTGAIDAATSPRRGGPRFVDPDQAAWAARVVDDPRSTEQLALDALTELVDVALRSSTTPAARRAAVRVLVTKADLDTGDGVGHLGGQTAPVSIGTVRRHVCESGYVPLLFDDNGRALDLGRTQRLHTPKQRLVIATRDGGCLVPDCDRPASWCEYHHITEYSKGGDTSVNDGILLCRHHHMLVHNNGWGTTRNGASYWLTPPPDIDPERRPIQLRSKSPTMRRLLTGGRPPGERVEVPRPHRVDQQPRITYEQPASTQREPALARR